MIQQGGSREVNTRKQEDNKTPPSVIEALTNSFKPNEEQEKIRESLIVAFEMSESHDAFLLMSS